MSTILGDIIIKTEVTSDKIRKDVNLHSLSRQVGETQRGLA